MIKFKCQSNSQNTSLIQLFVCSFFLLSSLLTLPAYANQSVTGDKNDNAVLFTFGEDSVNVSEFKYVYEKHNAQDPNQYSEQSIKDYLDLYINFKLKVREAEALGMDTIPNIIQQLGQYRKQLAGSYLQDKNVTEQIIREAYDRMKKEVSTSHILFMIGEDALPADTLKAYEKAVAVKKELESGGDFAKLARKYSQDPSVKDNNGDLGYITAFQTVYPFESAAFETKVGEVSQPIRTRYGYHLVKVADVREARGRVLVAHILVKSPRTSSPTKQKEAEARVQKVYQQLQEGTAFDELAKQRSQDRKTAAKGGQLPWFGSGRMLPEFEDAAFALEKVGDFSKPIRTKIGWHIIKLLDRKQVGTFDAMQMEIKKKVERDSRSTVPKKKFIQKLKKELQLQVHQQAFKEVNKRVDAKVLQGKWRLQNTIGLDSTVLTLQIPRSNGDTETKTYGQINWVNFIQLNQSKAKSKNFKTTINLLQKMFVEHVLLETEESRLEDKYPEFANLMREFRDGTLLFELTEQRVWNKALADTSGLRKFYEANKKKYEWGERLEATIFTCKDQDIAVELRKAAKKKKAKTEEVVAKFNPKNTPKRVEYTMGKYEAGQNDLIDQVEWKTGVSDPILNDDGTVSLVKIHKILKPMPKKLNEARGFIVADYQNELEKSWVGELREKYPVQVNQKVLKKVHK